MTPIKKQDEVCTRVERMSAYSHVKKTTDFAKYRVPHSSLVITRNLGEGSETEQVHVPRLFLRGLLPDVLLEDYDFWQNSDMNIVGYQHVHVQQRNQSAHALRIKLVTSGKFISAHVTRVPLAIIADGNQEHKVQQWEEERKIKDCAAELELLDLQYAEGNLAELADFFMQLEDLSSILCWTPAAPSAASSARSTHLVKTIELPRLQICFNATPGPDGIIRLYSSNHAGFFISQRMTDMLRETLRGLPHGVLLEDVRGDLSFVVPSRLPLRSRPTSWEDAFDTTIMFPYDMHYDGARHFVYPVHLSQTLLFTPTLASTLYLLLLRFSSRQYADVVSLADVCVSDVTLTVQVLPRVHANWVQ
jgi:hypothetical protein